MNKILLLCAIVALCSAADCPVGFRSKTDCSNSLLSARSCNTETTCGLAESCTNFVCNCTNTKDRPECVEDPNKCVITGTTEVGYRVLCCGAPGAPCCRSGDQCSAGSVCETSTNKCEASVAQCGSAGQACCSASPKCSTDLICHSDGKCVAPPPNAASPPPDATTGVASPPPTTGVASPPPTACGVTDSPCCTGTTTPCQTGNVCDSGTCRPCGQTDKPCCADGKCAQSGASCQSGICKLTVAPAPPPTTACGGVGELCCPTSAAARCKDNGICHTDGKCVAPAPQTACGVTDSPCCTGTNTPCQTGNLCLSGTCRPCGQTDKPCCADGKCAESGASCQSGICKLTPTACGATNAPCCTGSSVAQCQTGNTCQSNICVQSSTACGTNGATCCALTATITNPCAQGLSCQSQVCKPCGQTGSSCCAEGRCAESAASCQSGICKLTTTISCGKLNEQCCADGKCLDAGNRCESGQCRPICGRVTEKCCTTATSTTGFCYDSTVKCMDSICVKPIECGFRGQPCCTTTGTTPCFESTTKCSSNVCMDDCGAEGGRCCEFKREDGSVSAYCSASGTVCLSNICTKTTLPPPPSCGTFDLPCCKDSSIPCSTGLVCGSESKCVKCGSIGGACCPASISTVQCFSQSICADGKVCSSCGRDGEICCGNGGCATGLACNSERKCAIPVQQDCGIVGAACCKSADGSLTCNKVEGVEVRCNSGVCQRTCGNFNELCCTSTSGSASCASPLECKDKYCVKPASCANTATGDVCSAAVGRPCSTASTTGCAPGLTCLKASTATLSSSTGTLSDGFCACADSTQKWRCSAVSGCFTTTQQQLYTGQCAVQQTCTNCCYDNVVCDLSLNLQCVSEGGIRTCKCALGLVLVNGKCVAPSTCSPTCSDGKVCVDSNCQCGTGYTTDDTGACIKTVFTNNTCGDRTCRLNEICDKSTSRPFCACIANYERDSTTLCAPKTTTQYGCFVKEGIPVFCNANNFEECAQVTDSTQFHCRCKAGYRLVDGACKLISCQTTTATGEFVPCPTSTTANEGGEFLPLQKVCYFDKVNNREISCGLNEVCVTYDVAGATYATCKCIPGTERTVAGCVKTVDLGCEALSANSKANADNTFCVCLDGYYNAAAGTTRTLDCQKKVAAASCDAAHPEKTTYTWRQYCHAELKDCLVRDGKVACVVGAGSDLSQCAQSCGARQTCVAVRTSTGAVFAKCVCAPGWFGSNCDQRRCFYDKRVEADGNVTYIACPRYTNSVCRTIEFGDAREDACTCPLGSFLVLSEDGSDSGRCVDEKEDDDKCALVKCPSGTVCRNGECLCSDSRAALLDGACKVPDDTKCAQVCENNFKCIAGKCECPDGFVGAECDLTQCTSDGKCTDPNAYCMRFAKEPGCRCKEGFNKKDGICTLVSSGSAGSDTSETGFVAGDSNCNGLCVGDNTGCFNRQCACKPGFVEADNGLDCKAGAKCTTQDFKVGAKHVGNVNDEYLLKLRTALAERVGVPLNAVEAKPNADKTVITVKICEVPSVGLTSDGATKGTTVVTTDPGTSSDGLLGDAVIGGQNDDATVSSAAGVTASLFVVVAAVMMLL